MALLRDAFSKAPQLRSGRRSMPAVGGTDTASSVVVTPEKSLQVATVYAAVSTLSEDVAALPVNLFQKNPGYRTTADDHRLSDLLTEAPNIQIDSGEYWRTMMGWMLLAGNACTYVERNGAGLPIALWPISPANVEVKIGAGGKLLYKLTPDEDAEYVPVKKGHVAHPGEILHYRGFGLGVKGLSPIAMARQHIGTSFAATSYVGGFFARDASPGGLVSVPGELTDKQFDRMGEQWKSLHEGFANSHRLAILEGGAKWEKTTLSPADASFLEVYKLSRAEIAAIFRVPLHKVGDLERATFSNIEQQSLEYVTGSLVPWMTRLEKVTKRLFDPVGDKGMYMKFNVNGLLRGDSEARNKNYAMGRQWGYYSVNDILKMEDLDPIGPAGDVYLTPMNMSNGSEPSGMAEARAIAEVIQKMYLGVGKVISVEEARKILSDGGVPLEPTGMTGIPQTLTDPNTQEAGA